jgi:hypothetical protein
MTLEDELLIGYTSALNISKKQFKGIRIRHFELVTIVARFDRIRCCDVARIYGISQVGAYRRLQRCLPSGFIVKDGVWYSVSDSGKQMLNVLRDNMKDKIAVIKARMLADIRKQL